MESAMRNTRVAIVVGMLAFGLAPAFSARAETQNLRLPARERVESEKDQPLVVREKILDWDAAKTAIVVCDMWDKHWCEGATRRVGEMAPRMNEVLKAARAKGVTIIHCPSDTMDFYKDHPGRKLAQAAPKVGTKIPLEGWCHLVPEKEGKLPIDDSDGGCDDTDPAKQHRAWSRQHPALEIMDGDAITDSAEAFYFMKQKGIENVIVMGVHTNMCVLGRPFSIRQMVRQGQNVVLMRDMTDSMYNPAKEPRVSHMRGTELVIEHIERHWCPSITSTVFTGDPPLRFSEDHRPHVAIIVNDNEYHSDKTLRAFAQRELVEDRDWHVSFIDGDEKGGFRNMEVLPTADMAIIYSRRIPVRPEEKELIDAFVKSGKPLIGLRTASHAFSARGEAPQGFLNLETFDSDIWGGSYDGHTKSETLVTVAEGAAKHPYLIAVDFKKPWRSKSTLYRNPKLVKPAEILLYGEADGEKYPVAWKLLVNNVFYTSLGAPDDFEDGRFIQMLTNLLDLAVQDTLPEPTPADPPR
jgi:nicotinamidase-related amidase